MGNYTSKLFMNQGESDSKLKLQMHNESKNLEKYQCTPIMTRKSLSTDPRSATAGIVRTPIEVDATPTGVSRRSVSAIPKHLQIKPYLETDIDSIMDTLTPERRLPDPRSPNITNQRTPIVVKSVPEYSSSTDNMNEAVEINTQQHSISDLDPRSPAVDFDRTPIMKPKSPENAHKIPRDNITNCNVEPTSLKMTYCETTTNYIISEVQALPEIISYKPLSLEKRLGAYNEFSDERNLECESNSDVSSNESESEGQITVIPNVNTLTSHSQIPNINEKIQEELNNEFDSLKNLNSMNIIPKSTTNDDGNGKIRVWRDSISPKFLADPNVEVFKIPDEIIIEFDDEQKSDVKLQNKLGTAAEKTDKNKEPNGIFAMKKKKTQQLNKDIKFIYDDAAECNSNGAVFIDTQKNRTPLGNRSNHHKSRILTKSPQQLLRNKGHSTKSKQQENTPPRIKHGKSKNKSNTTQWDLNRTVVI